MPTYRIAKKKPPCYNSRMKEKNEPYRQDVAFIDRNKKLADLRLFIDKRPAEILFIHSSKSSGKTTLLYKFLGLRETFTNLYEDFLKSFFRVETRGEKKESLTSNIKVGFFKINAFVERKILQKRADPFNVMKAELLAEYYPQGKSDSWGIKLYFKSIEK